MSVGDIGFQSAEADFVLVSRDFNPRCGGISMRGATISRQSAVLNPRCGDISVRNPRSALGCTISMPGRAA